MGGRSISQIPVSGQGSGCGLPADWYFALAAPAVEPTKTGRLVSCGNNVEYRHEDLFQADFLAVRVEV